MSDKNDKNDKRWQNLMTQSGAFVTAAADARAKGDREGAAHLGVHGHDVPRPGRRRTQRWAACPVATGSISPGPSTRRAGRSRPRPRDPVACHGDYRPDAVDR